MNKAITCIFFQILLPFVVLAQKIDLSPTSNSGQIINHLYYSLSYIEEHEQAEWVFYELTKEDAEGTTKRINSYRPDPAVSTGSSDDFDFKGSGYDRGHLAPAGDMKRSSEAMLESFFYSNMSPQVAAFNQGIWNNLEIKVREWAVRKKHLYVATGPVLNSIIDTIGANEVSVPGYFYKVLLTRQDDNFQSIAFILPNALGTMELSEYAIRVDDLENLVNIDFWSNLPDSIENEIESKLSLSDWFSTKELDRKQVKDSEPLSSLEMPEYAVNSMDAYNHIGDTITVCGCIVSANYLHRSSSTYLNLDRKFPNHIFSFTIFGDNRNNFAGEPEKDYFGKKVCAKGEVRLLKGVPTINLSRERDIIVIP